MAKSPVRCPGQDLRFWKPDDIFCSRCPFCDAEMEFWKDEPFLFCRKCGREVRNPRLDLGCAKWCKFAAECLGRSPEDSEFIVSLRDRLIGAMKAEFGTDRKRIEHALAVLAAAEEIQRAEGGSPVIVKAAAILHDIGIQAAERTHSSSAAPFQELEGPPIARHILETLELGTEIQDHVCRIVGSHHSAKDIDTLEFRIVWDADWLVNFPDVYPGLDPAAAEARLRELLRTPTGLAVALQRFAAGRGGAAEKVTQ